MKTKIRTRTGSRADSLPFASSIARAEDASFVALPDGNQNAIRVLFDADTGAVLRFSDGTPRYCAPWLLANVFGS
jgi:hypothetical protein